MLPGTKQAIIEADRENDLSALSIFADQCTLKLTQQRFVGMPTKDKKIETYLWSAARPAGWPYNQHTGNPLVIP